MQVFERQTFDGKNDSRNPGRVYSDLELRGCYFEGCSLGYSFKPYDINLRSTLRNSKLIGCSQRGCSIGPAIIEDVLIEHLKTHGQHLQTWGTVFKHVTLKGKIDRLMLSQIAKPSEPATSPTNQLFAKANDEYFSTIDWALDISCAEVKEMDIRGIPAHLVKRDPETQVVVTAERALKNNFKRLDYGKTYWGVGIQFMLNQGYKDVVLVAPKRSREFKVLLEGLQMLRREGIAEPD
jgi:hypothetical protein